MFKLEPNPTFWAPVEIHVPGQGKGQLEVEFRYLDKEARKTYFESLSSRTNLDALTEIVVDWREIDAPFNADNLERLLESYVAAATGFYEGYFKELSGAAEKN